MTASDFEKRWSAARRWMLVLTPSAPKNPTSSGSFPASPAASSPDQVTPCDAQIASAVQQAQQNRLDESERTLVGALSCPGAAVFRELLTYMLQDPHTIEPSLDLILISRHLERIGDHATNIAEDVIFMVSARDVRHHVREI